MNLKKLKKHLYPFYKDKTYHESIIDEIDYLMREQLCKGILIGMAVIFFLFAVSTWVFGRLGV